MNRHRSILLIISGSIAAYKALEMIRSLRKQAVAVDVILTQGGAQFITPLAVSSLTGRKCYTDLFDLTDEVEMGHIQLSRKHDLILVAPASADLLAKMANGLCDDLASTALLATDKPVFVAPAMNVQMWNHPATRRNVAQLKADGIAFIEPASGELACGETGEGRMAEPMEILETILSWDKKRASRRALPRAGESPGPCEIQEDFTGPLKNKKILITAGPTHEPIDPVRFIGNRSSGKQGIAIARALADAGADVQLILGPSSEIPPANVVTLRVTTARQMFDAVRDALPADIAVCTAAVADWAPVQSSRRKLKKRDSQEAPALSLKENPDILRWLSREAKPRPALVIGFAAETEKLLANAAAKREAKGCDWLLANEVGEDKIFGQDHTDIHLLTDDGAEHWQGSKTEIADRLLGKIIDYFSETAPAPEKSKPAAEVGKLGPRLFSKNRKPVSEAS